MAARILHFGNDECNRLMVLRHAGYSVEICPSLLNLDTALHNDGGPAAVLMSDMQSFPRHEVVTHVHSQSSAPIILFQHNDYTPGEAEFDLVIPNLTPTREWLEKIAATIERTRAIRDNLSKISAQSAELKRECASVREEARQERRRAASIRARTDALIADANKFRSPNDKN